MSTPENPSLFTEEQRAKVNERFYRAVETLGESIGTLGTRDYRQICWTLLNPQLRASILDLAKAFSSTAPTKVESGKTILSHDVDAVAKGLTIGSEIARQCLTSPQYSDFAAEESAAFNKLRSPAEGIPRVELTDLIKDQGYPAARRLFGYPGGVEVFGVEELEAMPMSSYGDLYISALGYIAADTLNYLTEAEMRETAKVDRSAFRDITDLAYHLGSPEVSLTSEIIDF